MSKLLPLNVTSIDAAAMRSRTRSSIGASSPSARTRICSSTSAAAVPPRQTDEERDRPRAAGEPRGLRVEVERARTDRTPRARDRARAARGLRRSRRGRRRAARARCGAPGTGAACARGAGRSASSSVANGGRRCRPGERRGGALGGPLEGRLRCARAGPSSRSARGPSGPGRQPARGPPSRAGRACCGRTRPTPPTVHRFSGPGQSRSLSARRPGASSSRNSTPPTRALDDAELAATERGEIDGFSAHGFRATRSASTRVPVASSPTRTKSASARRVRGVAERARGPRVARRRASARPPVASRMRTSASSAKSAPPQ